MTADAPREVPAFEAQVFAPRRTRYCVAVPVINEGDRILGQLRKMQAHAGLADVILADGGSTDGSTDPERLKALGLRALLVKTGPGKLGAQIRMAMAWALDEGYEGVILVDGNDKDDTTEIVRFIEKLDAGYDFIQGSRFIPGGRAVRNPASRVWGIRLLHAPAISLSARHRYTDTTNGFRAYSRRLLTDPRVALFRDTLAGYELHYYLAIRAARLGFRVCEVPVTRIYPDDGSIPTKIGGWRGNLKILRVLADTCLHRYDP